MMESDNGGGLGLEEMAAANISKFLTNFEIQDGDPNFATVAIPILFKKC